VSKPGNQLSEFYKPRIEQIWSPLENQDKVQPHQRTTRPNVRVHLPKRRTKPPFKHNAVSRVALAIPKDHLRVPHTVAHVSHRRSRVEAERNSAMRYFR
jgi:hypothetical protein